MFGLSEGWLIAIISFIVGLVIAIIGFLVQLIIDATYKKLAENQNTLNSKLDTIIVHIAKQELINDNTEKEIIELRNKLGITKKVVIKVNKRLNEHIEKHEGI